MLTITLIKLSHKLGEIISLSAKHKTLSEKSSADHLKFNKQEIANKDLEKKIFSLEDNLKKFRKVMFEKELGDRKIISDLKHNLSNASQLIRLNEMNKKADTDKKHGEISEMERIRVLHDSRLQQVSHTVTHTVSISSVQNRSNGCAVDMFVQPEKITKSSLTSSY